MTLHPPRSAPAPVAAPSALAPIDHRGVGGRGTAATATALLRIALGLIFVWAFVDKLFGLGYSTSGARSWVAGGSPTSGFLGHTEVGPFASMFRSWSGAVVLDWLFMLALAGIGVAVLLGVALRAAAVGGAVLMALMWIAEWPLARYTEVGDPTGSTNPLIDYHVIYALALIAVAWCGAGVRLGLGRRWAETDVVRRFSWLA